MNSGIKISFPVPTYQHETSVWATVAPSGSQNYWYGEIAAYRQHNAAPPSYLHYNNSLLLLVRPDALGMGKDSSARAVVQIARVGKNIFLRSDTFQPDIVFPVYETVIRPIGK